MALFDHIYGLFSFFRGQGVTKIPPGTPILIAGQDAVVVYAQVGTGLERRIVLPLRTTGFEGALAEVLQSLKPAPPPLLMLNDTNQRYRVEEIPATLTWYDAPRYLKRKSEISFPDAIMRGSLRRAPDPDHRKSAASYITVTIDKTAAMLRLTSAFASAGVWPFACVTLPLESVSLVTELAAKLPREGAASRWVVMIAHHENGSLRQIVVRDGNLALTRLTPVPALPGEAKWDEEVAREFNTTLNYMARFGFKPEQGLDFIVLCQESDKAFFMKKPDAARNVMAVTVAEAMKAVLPAVAVSPPAGNYADALHAAWTLGFGSLRVAMDYPRLMPPTKDGKTVH